MSDIDKNTIIASSFKNLVNSIVCDLSHFPFACIKKKTEKIIMHLNAAAMKKIINSTLTGFPRIYYKPSKMFVFKSVLGTQIM